MANIKIGTLEKIKINEIVWFAALTSVAVVLPHYVHNQFITGPIVNAVLFIAVMTIGTANAIAIGLIPSVIALASGLLPAPLAPMVPFIMISNTVLVLTFSYFKKLNYWSGVLGGTLFKYAFLYGTSLIVVNLITNQTIAAKASATMMAWPQIVTAMIGGVIAYGVVRIIKVDEK